MRNHLSTLATAIPEMSRPPTASHPVRGYLYIAAATFFWGVSATMGRAAFTGRLLPGGRALGPIDPLILAQSRTTFSFFAFLLLLVPRRGWRQLSVSAADLGRLLLLGVLGLAASNYFYYLAIQKTNVATAIVVQYTAPVWVLAFMVARGLQKPTLSRIGAVTLALTGIAMVIGIFGSGGLRLNMVGVIAALIAAVSYAFYNITGHRLLEKYQRGTVLLYATFSAALFWICVNPPSNIMAANYSWQQWVFLATFSIVSMLVPFTFYFAGLQLLEPTRAVIVSCLEPVFSILIAAVVLGEGVHRLQIMGVLMVLAATVVVQLPDKKQGTAMPPMEPIE
jgi:DME family drug/metabolite transporter